VEKAATICVRVCAISLCPDDSVELS